MSDLTALASTYLRAASAHRSYATDAARIYPHNRPEQIATRVRGATANALICEARADLALWHLWRRGA